MTKTFTTMQYDNRHLVIRNTPEKNPVVIATCYLPEIAEIICKLLTDAAQDKTKAKSKAIKTAHRIGSN